MNNLAIREQSRADGISLDDCYNCGTARHIARDCPSSHQGGGGHRWVTGVVVEAKEEDAAIKAAASRTTKTLPQPTTRRLPAATTASSRSLLELSGASMHGGASLPLPTTHTRDLSRS